MTDGHEPAPDGDLALEERLSRPTPAVMAALAASPGSVIVLGAGGKMGPSLTRMAWRAAQALGDGRRVTAVSRWRDATAADALADDGVQVIHADLDDTATLAALPDAPNVIFMAGRKFGTDDAPADTWQANTVLPARIAERFAASRIVAFSSGNVYPVVPRDTAGAREDHPPGPVGEYANSCLARERVLEFASRRRGTPMALVRLNYAVDLRYGVLVDIARTVLAGEPVPGTMGAVNVIWQGTANAWSLCCLAHAATPPFVVNVTGRDVLRVREVAERFAERFGMPARISGTEAPDALLSDSALAHELFGDDDVPAHRLIDWVSTWVERGGARRGGPTHFESRDGRY
ncbi:MAG TPA: NAD-dependent epimerase/dehydratase family protein [Gemmatimonadaceae bacterium]|nr:NAD-dependent epimerase/dehydratase family protein [Gemmatimonadaceae bacterium]